MKIRDELGVDEEHDEAVDTTLLDDDVVAEQVDVDAAEEEQKEELVLSPMGGSQKTESTQEATSAKPEESKESVRVEEAPEQKHEEIATAEVNEQKTEEVAATEDKPKSSIASTVASLDKEDLDTSVAHNWYTKAGAELRPMGGGENSEPKRVPMREREDEEDEDTTNIMRDIEYLEDDE